MKEKIGKKYYSEHFKQWIEVVQYLDDNHWTFKLENGEVYTAQTPLSYFEGHAFTRDNPKRAVKQDMSKGQFVDGTDKTNDKIEEIIDKKFETCWVDKRSAIAHVHKDRIEELKSELNTELQKAVDIIIKKIEVMAFDKEASDITQEYQSTFLDGYNQAIEEVVEYLQSLDKGDTDENR